MTNVAHNRRGVAIILVVIAAFMTATPVHAEMRGGTYYSPDGEFTLDAPRPNSDFRFGKEIALKDRIIVDFPFVLMNFYGFSANRSVEWLKLAAPLATDQNRVWAPEVVRGYLSSRFENPDLQLIDSEFPTETTYNFLGTFKSSGKLNIVHGTVTFFGDRIALLIEFHDPISGALPTGVHSGKTLSWEDFMSWASSLKRVQATQ